MSKIQQLLNEGSIINVNLMSDQLNTILSELCTVISEQNQEIQILKEEIKKYATHDEIISQYESMKSELSKISSETKKNTSDNQILSNAINQMYQKSEEQLHKQIKESKDNLLLEMETRKKDADGAYTIVNQQIKNIWQKVDKDILTEMKQMKEDISSVQTIIEQGKSQSLEAISYKVQQLESQMNENKRIDTENNDIHDNEIKQIKTTLADFQSEMKDEVKCFATEIQEIRRTVVDAPSFDLDGKIDTETIINAIKRDSRRIDSFNEIIASVRNQNDIVSKLFVDLSAIVSQIDEQLHEFIKEHNSTKFSLIKQIDQSYANTELLRNDFIRIENNVEETVKANLNSMNTVSSTFASLYLFLEKLTTRNPPKFPTFDDEVLEFQRIHENVISQKESKNKVTNPFQICLIDKDHEKQKVGEFMTSDAINELKTEFKLPTLSIPKVELNIDTKKSIVNYLMNEENKANNGVKPVTSNVNLHKQSNLTFVNQINNSRSNNEICDTESRQSIMELSKSIVDLKDEFNSIKDTVDKNVNRKKADSQNIDRMLERVKEMNSKLQNSINSMNKNLLNYVQRDEINEIIKECISAASGEITHSTINRRQSPPLLTASHYLRKPQKTKLPMLCGSNILANEIVKYSRWGERSKSTAAHVTLYGAKTEVQNEQNHS